MLLFLLRDSLLGILCGNLWGFISSFRNNEIAIWVSHLYVVSDIRKRRIPFGKRLFGYILALGFTFVAAIFYFGHPLTRIIAIPFLLFAIYVWYHFIHTLFSRLYFFPDRIEQRLGYFVKWSTPWNQLTKIRREKGSHGSAVLYYLDDTWGEQTIGSHADAWFIPPAVFKEESLSFLKVKLDANLFDPHAILPEGLNALDTKTTISLRDSWKLLPADQKMVLVLFFVFNPITLILFAPGWQASVLIQLIWFGLFDASVAWSRWVIRWWRVVHS